MKLDYHESARREFRQAVRFYDEQRLGLGSEFVEAVRRTAELVLEYPELGVIEAGGARRHRVVGFPFTLVYSRDGENFRILAVCHQSRDPGYWRPRLHD